MEGRLEGHMGGHPVVRPRRFQGLTRKVGPCNLTRLSKAVTLEDSSHLYHRHSLRLDYSTYTNPLAKILLRPTHLCEVICHGRLRLRAPVRLPLLSTASLI